MGFLNSIKTAVKKIDFMSAAKKAIDFTVKAIKSIKEVFNYVVETGLVVEVVQLAVAVNRLSEELEAMDQGDDPG